MWMPPDSSLVQKRSEYLRHIEEERKRLLAVSDFESLRLSEEDRYQRNRYLREIEGNRMVGLPNMGGKIDNAPVKKVSKFWGPGHPDYDRMKS